MNKVDKTDRYLRAFAWFIIVLAGIVASMWTGPVYGEVSCTGGSCVVEDNLEERVEETVEERLQWLDALIKRKGGYERISCRERPARSIAGKLHCTRGSKIIIPTRWTTQQSIIEACCYNRR